jgi:hypothetical protein
MKEDGIMQFSGGEKGCEQDKEIAKDGRLWRRMKNAMLRKEDGQNCQKLNACRGGWSDAVPRSRGGLWSGQRRSICEKGREKEVIKDQSFGRRPDSRGSGF